MKDVFSTLPATETGSYTANYEYVTEIWLYYNIVMKRILITIFLIISAVANATNYYIKTGGNDAAAGTSDATAWATITKVNSFWSAGSFAPGDQILFKRGDTFYGTITVKEAGTSGSPIVIGAYGTGDKPIIEGFTTITLWTYEGNNIYSASLTCESSTNMVIIDGTQYWMGRWPNTGWMYIDETANPESIVDYELTGTPDWKGAEIVIRKNRWIIDRHPITNHVNNTLEFASSSDYAPRVGWGYFIQSSISALDGFGDWYYDASASRLYMYFGSDSPVDHYIRASTLNRCLFNNSYDYITIDSITFQGANEKTIYGFYAPEYMIIQNCNILFSGTDAIYMHYPNHCELSNTTINYTNSNAVYFGGGSGEYNTISNNVITNTGTIMGAGNSNDETYDAIYSEGHYGIIENNSIVHTGYLGINFKGTNTLVKNNFINYCCYIKDDGAGIYTYHDFNPGKRVIDNIVLNSIGAPSGTDTTTYPAYSSANGLYSDGETSNILYSGNTIGYISNAGYHGNNPANVTLKNNTFYQCKQFLTLWRYDDAYITDLDIENNIFVSTQINENLPDVIVYEDSNGTLYNNDIVQEINHLGVINNNYYYTNTECMMFFNTSTGTLNNAPYSISRWASVFGHDLNSVILDKFPEYTINSLGSNKISNSTFNSDINGWTGTGTAPISWSNEDLGYGGCLKLNNMNETFNFAWWRSSYFFSTPLSGGVDNEKYYILRLSGKSDIDEKTVAFRTYQTGTGSPIQRFFTLGKTTTQKEILLKNPDSNINATLRIVGCDDLTSIYFDNVYFYEAHITLNDVESNFLFEYNATDISRIITIDDPMIDAKGTKYTTEITLLPYASVVLMEDPGNPPSIMNQSFQIVKNSPYGTLAGTVVASDPDAGQTLIYSIVSGNTNDAFTINASTGVLFVANGAALNTDFALVVKVQDNGPGNLSSQAIITINVIPTGIESTGTNSTIKVYPNPVSDELIIEIEWNNYRQDFEILNSIGNIIFKGNLSERTTVPTTNFSAGVYYIKVENGRYFKFTKIVKLSKK